MSAGSDNSNLGYGNQSPFVGNGNFVNPDNSHSPGGFGSNEAPMFGKFGLPGAAYNVNAANSCIPGLCYKGGAKKLKHKIKNITKMYKKMRGGRKTFKKRVKSIKRRLVSRYNKSGGRSRRRRGLNMKGGMGYTQYQNNLPMTNSYSIANVKLGPSDSALANPAPYQKLSNCTNCVDNYNRNTNTGVPSWGWQ